MNSEVAHHATGWATHPCCLDVRIRSDLYKLIRTEYNEAINTRPSANHLLFEPKCYQTYFQTIIKSNLPARTIRHV